VPPAVVEVATVDITGSDGRVWLGWTIGQSQRPKRNDMQHWVFEEAEWRLVFRANSYRELSRSSSVGHVEYAG